MRHHLVIPALRVGVLLLDERDPAQAAHQRGVEIGVRQIAFETDALSAVAVEEEHRRRPDRLEAMEPRRMFLDVGFDRDELLVDELRSPAVAVRLGFQPSARPSRRRGAEIEQQRTVLRFRGGKRRVDVSTPVDGHSHLLRTATTCPFMSIRALPSPVPGHGSSTWHVQRRPFF